jgi:peptide/nickel transport system permease protein
VAEIRRELGLDQPLLRQYADWIAQLLSGDAGRSLFNGESVAEAIRTRFPVTLSLMVGAGAVATTLGLSAGIISAVKRGTWIDRFLTVAASSGLALPLYWTALLGVYFLSIRADWLPATGWVPLTEDPFLWAQHIILPSVALGLAGAAEISRVLRGSMTDVLDMDYVRTARAKGLRGWVVVTKHALRNAAVPLVTILGPQAASRSAARPSSSRSSGCPAWAS